MTKNKVKYYVVWIGQKPGIYDSWEKCQQQIIGFPNAKYKSFKSLSEAEKAYKQSATTYFAQNKKPQEIDNSSNTSIIKNSISVDAACSKNPGLMEYRGVNTVSKKEYFRVGPLEDGTNNIGEFLAIVHALALLKRAKNDHTIIYTDSKTAMSWVKNKKVKTTLEVTKYNKEVHQLIERALKWLNNNEYKTKILKWETKKWGEIPADFGRK